MTGVLAHLRAEARPRWTAWFGVVLLLGSTAFAVVLVSGVPGRRRELAVLKTFGFRSRDVAGTVAWQATATAVLASVLGIAAARTRPATMLRAE